LTPSFALKKSKVKANVEPLPILLITLIFPPCDSTNCLEIASPNPVPPYNLEVPLDACWKFSNIFPILLSSIPIPVSLTENSILTFSLSSFSK